MMKRVLTSILTLAWIAGTATGAEPSAEQILDTAGVQGGLVVHLGCGDGRLTTALHVNERYLVHGLDSSADDIDAARQFIHSQGLYGKVAVELLASKQLPYSDNLVNLVVVSDDGCPVSENEILRVLRPGGAAIRLDPDTRHLTPNAFLRKPWPGDIDQWTHFLHDASGNAVAKDRQVGPPKHLQWTAGPKRTRDHDALASFTTMTSSNGRVFYILDEGPTSQIHRQAQWRLVARDGFNGVPLWEREIPSWVTHLYNFRAGPVHMTRRLVSVGDRVYVTLGYDAPVSVLDAATGETISTMEGSQNTEEIIVQDDVLLTVLGNPRRFDQEAPKIDGYWETRGEGEPGAPKWIVAYRASTGELLWKRSAAETAYLVPLSLTAGAGKFCYLDRDRLHCAELQTGRDLWSAPYTSEGLFLRNYAPTVVLYKDVIVCLSLDKMAAFSSDDGRVLWTKEQGYQGFGSPGDLFVVNDLVWTFPHTAGVQYEAKDRVLGNGGKEFLALDLYSGEVKHTIAKNDVWPGGHHHRCYRNKATEQFAVCGRRGLEFVDLTGGDQNVINWWVRGICQYGVMPCNGMIYAPPDPCQCFSTIKVDGLLALVADNSLDTLSASEDSPLIQGPAYGLPNVLRPPASGLQPVIDWPTYRRDATRSGSTVSTVSAQLSRQWEADLGGMPSGVVVAQGRVLAGVVDQYTVVCLDAKTGARQWQFTAGGPVDSPPTVVEDLAIFGSRDGRVYAVRVTDGQLAWSYRAGPCDRRILGQGRLESVWPVHGSVLELDGVVYFAAGRSSFLDGGIRLVGLDARTGEKRYETRIDSAPAHNQNSGALPDVLVWDGATISMRQLSFDKQLQRAGKRGSFAAPTGFLEGEWGHRLTWRLGGSSGNLLVFNEDSIFGAESRYTGWKKNQANWPPTHSGHLHQKYSRYQPEWFPIGNRVFAQPQNAGKQGRRQGEPAEGSRQWSMNAPIQIRSMVLAGDTLFAAGWPDAVTVMGAAGTNTPERDLQDPKLWAVSTVDGKTVAEYDLDGLPIFDGAAAAYGQLFVPLDDGKIVCFSGGRP